jgi:NAD(P)-dependent dehydrogenase (short-subunit alcohol dehydrogenase family)
VPHAPRGGAIVMIASIWGRESAAADYNAVKAAEISLAKAMAQQLAADNIRVNSVAGVDPFCGRVVGSPSSGRSRWDGGVRL